MIVVAHDIINKYLIYIRLFIKTLLIEKTFLNSQDHNLTKLVHIEVKLKFENILYFMYISHKNILNSHTIYNLKA